MEIWKDIKGYEGIYQVSNLGNVKSFHKGEGRLLANLPNSRGYPQVALCKNGKPKSVVTHSLVAQAFLGDRPQDFDINHIDGNKQNNVVGNLEYCSQSQNVCHAVANNLTNPPRGEAHANSKLTDDKVRLIKHRLANGESQYVIARSFGVSHVSIGRIKRGETWVHIN